MKKLIVLSIALAMCAGFSSCKKKKTEPEKSKACEIVKFTAGGKDWAVSGTTVTAAFAKGTQVHSLTPVIEVSAGATVEPKSGVVQDFSGDQAVTYTVTAEDGVSTKSYTAKATVTTAP
jgi:hypothetical protein